VIQPIFISQPVADVRTRRGRAQLTLVAVAAALLAAGLWLLAAAGRRARGIPAGSAVVAELRSASVPLTDAPQNAPSLSERSVVGGPALAAIDRLTAGSALVALGESTHGTHEFFALKDALIRHFVAARGTRLIAMEAPWYGSAQFDAFIVGGPGTAEQAVRALILWPWITEELASLARWLRAYNDPLPADARVRIVGVDPQLPPGRASTPPGMAMAVAALDSARIARQHRDMSRFGFRWWASWRRDRAMGLNALAAVRANRAGGPVILWAHDGHIQRARFYQGGVIADSLGDRYAAIALLAGEGAFNAIRFEGPLRPQLGPWPLRPPPRRSLEHAFREAGFDAAFLDLRAAARRELTAPETSLGEWLAGRVAKRSVGAVFTPGDTTTDFYPARVARQWDGVLFVARSTPSRLIGRGRPKE